MSSKHKQPIFDLDAEERELSDSFDRGEWSSVKHLEAEKEKAAFEGLSYQTLTASVLHKFAAGHL